MVVYSVEYYFLKNFSKDFSKDFTNIFVLAIHLHDVFKTFPRRIQDIFKTSCQDVFKTFWRRVQDIFKTSSRRFKEVFKTSSGHLQDVLQRCLQDLFKMYHQIKLFAWVKDLPRSHFWEIYGQCRKFTSVIKISQVLA